MIKHIFLTFQVQTWAHSFLHCWSANKCNSKTEEKKQESQKVKLKLKPKVFRLWKPPAAKCRRSRWVSASLNSSSHPLCWLRISPSPCPATAGLFSPPPRPPFSVSASSNDWVAVCRPPPAADTGLRCRQCSPLNAPPGRCDTWRWDRITIITQREQQMKTQKHISEKKTKKTQSVGSSPRPCRRSIPSGLPPPPLLGCCRRRRRAALWRIPKAASLYKFASIVSAGAPAVMKYGLLSLPLNMLGRGAHGPEWHRASVGKRTEAFGNS